MAPHKVFPANYWMEFIKTNMHQLDDWRVLVDYLKIQLRNRHDK